MSDRIVEIETLRDPHAYSDAQIRLACLIHTMLDRGKLILCLEPEPDR